MNKWLVLAALWFAGSLYALFFRGGGVSAPPFAHFDKVAHLGLFFGQFWLLAKAFIEAGRPLPWRGLLIVALVWAVGSELLQALFTRSRQGEVLDVLADVAGAALAVYLAYRIWQARRTMGDNRP